MKRDSFEFFLISFTAKYGQNMNLITVELKLRNTVVVEYFSFAISNVASSIT